MKNYRFVNQELYGQNFKVIVGTDESGQEFWIPINNDNTDYQEYLEWVAEGNTPEAAD